jgi:hypothetical protein
MAPPRFCVTIWRQIREGGEGRSFTVAKSYLKSAEPRVTKPNRVGLRRRALKTLSLLLALSLAFPGANAQAEIFSVIVKLGGEAVKLLIEKRGDMLVAIVGGAIVTVGDHALSAVLENKDVKSDDPAAKSSSCVKIGTGVMTCPDDVKMAGETPATQEQINRALTGLHSNFGISTALAAEPKHPFVQFHNTAKQNS